MSLDGWRGICAILVATYHFSLLSDVGRLQIVRHAYLMVDFFFVLSGFIITSAYRNHIRSTAEIAAFLYKRWARLWPLHAFMLLVLFLWEVVKLVSAPPDMMIGAFKDERSIISFFHHLTLVNAWHLEKTLTWNIPSWSISAEWAVCIIFSLATFLSGRFLPLLSIVFAILAWSILVLFYPNIDQTLDMGVVRASAGFFFGCFAFSIRRSSGTKRLYSVLEIGVTLVTLFYVTVVHGSKFEFGVPVLFTLLVLVFSADRGVISRVLASHPFQFLGRISYSVYLVHFPIIVFLDVIRKFIERRFGLALTKTYTLDGHSHTDFFLFNSFVMDFVSLIYICIVYCAQPQPTLWLRAEAGSSYTGYWRGYCLPALDSAPLDTLFRGATLQGARVV